MQERERAHREAERFQRVWARVAPEGNARIVPRAPEEPEPPELQAPPDAAALLVWETALRAEAEALWRRTRAEGLCRLLRASHRRTRQLTAASFLLTGNRPRRGQCCPTPARPAPSGGLPALYHALFLLEDGYRALLERAEDPVLAERYAALAESCQAGRRLVLALAEQ